MAKYDVEKIVKEVEELISIRDSVRESNYDVNVTYMKDICLSDGVLRISLDDSRNCHSKIDGNDSYSH